jgi:general stress protein 26
MRARILRGLGVVAGASLAYYSAPSSTRTFVDEVASGAKAVVVPKEQHNFVSLFPRLIKPISCEESKHEVEHKVEDVLRASFDLFKSVDGLVMFFTHNASDSAGPPSGRTVRCYKTPKEDVASDATDPNWCERLWIPTNLYTDKVKELNKNDTCSVGAYDRFGNYFVMQGHCVSKVTVKSGAFYKNVLNKLWEENDDLWNHFQDGPNGNRFVLIEFVPTKLSVISSKFNLADENNSWKPAVIERSASG